MIHGLAGRGKRQGRRQSDAKTYADNDQDSILMTRSEAAKRLVQLKLVTPTGVEPVLLP